MADRLVTHRRKEKRKIAINFEASREQLKLVNQDLIVRLNYFTISLSRSLNGIICVLNIRSLWQLEKITPIIHLPLFRDGMSFLLLLLSVLHFKFHH